MGRPRAPVPDGFADAFERMGWDARDALGMNTGRFKRCLVAIGSEEARARRRNYVLGNRLSRRVSSLKPDLSGV
jgi:hypothetical protein